MTVKIKIWCEYSYTEATSDWQDSMVAVRNHIEQALDDASMSHDVSIITSEIPDMPKPINLYDSENSDAWDKWLNDNNAYVEDSNILLMFDKGGVTFGSGRNPNTTTDGCMTLLGAEDLLGIQGTQTEGKSEHYHDIYNGLHELSHALDAPTGSSCIGQYWEDNNNEYHRTPAQTKYGSTTVCGLWHNGSYQGNTWWDLTYYGCAQGYLTDQ
ncbi:hypothetical protein [Haladaptatus cibarius]|uniref:hypothetical protein n=1 Tax=Haladaptatus cibarius TaxID=453847 RepID=UPI000678629E|nr:hypothetical protein [Haladaptatus cibarius]